MPKKLRNLSSSYYGHDRQKAQVNPLFYLDLWVSVGTGWHFENCGPSNSPPPFGPNDTHIPITMASDGVPSFCFLWNEHMAKGPDKSFAINYKVKLGNGFFFALEMCSSGETLYE